jgi:non-specific serine/threonine protein kinase
MQPALERALILTETLQSQPVQSPSRAAPSSVLTARAREIATLIARGHSNRDISEQLVISEGTVEVHVKHILGKLGFRSRAQVAAWFSQGLGGNVP